MALSNPTPRRDVTADLGSLREQLEHLTALVDRYREGKDASVAADVVAKARDFIARATQTTTSAAEHSIESIARAGHDLADSARGSASHAIDDLGETFSRNPITTALAAAGAGLLVGMLLRRT